MQAVAKICIEVRAEPSHKNVDSRHDGNLSGFQSFDAVLLREWFPKCRRNVDYSCRSQNQAYVFNRTPGDSVNSMVTSD